jgi:hypothetical protein
MHPTIYLSIYLGSEQYQQQQGIREVLPIRLETKVAVEDNNTHLGRSLGTALYE